MLKNMSRAIARLAARGKSKKPQSRITIGDKTYEGNTLDIVGGSIYVNGKKVDELESTTLTVRVVGTLGDLNTDLNVNCDAVAGNVNAHGNVNCGSVDGDVSAGNNVVCGRIKGKLIARGNVVSS
tara:strand:- start:156 stop:530 length:375 start_codon:yes stop_codon:yes gene_type:complete